MWIRMKLFIAAVLCIVAAGADRLENTYLPPSGAALSAGGDGNALNAPLGSSDPSSGERADPHSYRRTGNGEHSGRQNPDANAATLRFQNENNPDGTYNYEFDTENGIHQQESGELRDLGGEDGDVIVVRGSYSYVAPDGNTYTVEYIADENGFQPSGEHIPEAIQKASQPNNEEYDYQRGVEHNLKSTGYHSATAQNNNIKLSGYNADAQSGFNSAGYQSEITQNGNLESSAGKQATHNNAFQSGEEQTGYPLNLAPLEKVNAEVLSKYNQHPSQQNAIHAENHESHGYTNNPQIAPISAKDNLQGFAQQHGYSNNVHTASISNNQRFAQQHKAHGYPKHGERTPQGFTQQQDFSGRNHVQHSTSSNNHHETENRFSAQSGHTENHFSAGNVKSQESHAHSGYPVSHQSSSHASNSFGSYESHHAGSSQHQEFSTDVQTNQGYPAASGYPVRNPQGHEHVATDAHHPASSQDYNHSGYPASSPNHDDHDGLSGVHNHPGYPASSHPINVPQGFVPQQEEPVSTDLHHDNIDSSHQHDDGNEEEQDSVVVEAAARRYQPPQVPGGRATSGQQAFDEQTGYQY